MGVTSTTLLAASLTPSSRLMYARELRRYRAFCIDHFGRRSWFPASDPDLAAYITHRFNADYASSTIRSSVSALSFFHKVLGLPDPSGSFYVKKLMLGARKARPSLDLRSPVTPAILNALISATRMCSPDTYTMLLLRAMFTLAFYALLRLCEMAGSRDNSPHVLQFADVSISTKCLQITFTSYKHSNGRPFSLSIPATKCSSCPVKHLQQYIDRRGTHPGPLFQAPGTAGPVSRAFFTQQLTNAVSAAGLEGCNIQSHSFRIGRVSHLTELGTAETTIKLMGRWRSDAYKSYVRVSSFTVQ